MPDSFVPQAPPTAAEIRSFWDYTLSPYQTRRRPTRQVAVGNIMLGGHNPIRLQSMTISDTMDTSALVAEITALWEAGSEMVRVTAPNRTCAEHLGIIRAELRSRRIDVPLIADIHFTPQAALIAAEHVDKVRINPGNYADRKHFKKWEYTDADYQEELERLDTAFSPLVLRCRDNGVAMRIGTNHGSLSDRILNRYGDTPGGMVASAIEFVRICERHGYHDIVLSMKASNVKVMIQAYRLLAARMYELGMDYPFHLGVTEAGSGMAARVKSSIGIATLLQDGIGDTVRVSLTEDSVHEIPVARDICAPFQDCFTDVRDAAESPAPLALRPPWNPLHFERRNIVPQGDGRVRLATDVAPRLELRVAADDPETLAKCLAGDPAPDLLLLEYNGASAADENDARTQLNTLRSNQQGIAYGLQLPAQRIHETSLLALLPADTRLALLVHPGDLPALLSDSPWRAFTNLQYTLATELVANAAALDDFLSALVTGKLPAGGVALQSRGEKMLAQTWRQLLARHPKAQFPIILRDTAETPLPGGDSDLHRAAALGALLVDGVGDAIQWQASGDPAQRLDLAREILQSTRLRLSVADFIACPSCGRTQFDLQATSARIQQRFRHLKGLKIAIMGCIVNGPGEMADADFGYVGSGPGKIDLYFGQERVERAIPEAQAVERLVELIRSRGRWVDPLHGNSAAPEGVHS